MVETLRRSLEQIAPPTCPACHVEMPWFQSIMVSRDPVSINHFFVCPTCHRAESITSTVPSSQPVPPVKLSAPRLRLVK